MHGLLGNNGCMHCAWAAWLTQLRPFELTCFVAAIAQLSEVGSDVLAVFWNISRLRKQLRMLVFLMGGVNYAWIIPVFIVGRRIGCTCTCNWPFWNR